MKFIFVIIASVGKLHCAVCKFTLRESHVLSTSGFHTCMAIIIRLNLQQQMTSSRDPSQPGEDSFSE
jgi:hypothetical protein